MAEIVIGGRAVGDGHPPLIIAEISANHNGSLETAQKIVRAAAEFGADAIKLQTFTPESLTIDSRRPEFFIDDSDGLWHGRRLWELYAEAHTPRAWHKPIFESARAAGLACISSAFDIDSVQFLTSLGVDAIKIASHEIIHIPLIEAAAKSGKPLLLSIGMASLAELDDAVGALRASGCAQFILLKCTSAYPSDESNANVLTIPEIKSRYSCDVGLSDHTLRPYVAFAATALGACIIEKHFTIARADGGLDSPFSIEPSELSELSAGTELVWKSLGKVSFGVLGVEKASFKERPSIYVVRSMTKGEKFTVHNIRIIRPAGGIAPKQYRDLIGRACARDVAAESPLSWDMVLDGDRTSHETKPKQS